MPVPNIDEVKALLASRERALSQVVLMAWDRWWQNPDRLAMSFKRTRATVIHNFMMNLAPEFFADDDGIRPVYGQETTYFVAEQSLVFRLKLGDGCGISRNLETQFSLAYTDPQQSLPGIPDLARVDVVYELNALETLVANVAVVARDCERAAWQYSIYPRADADSFPIFLPTAPAPPSPANNVVRLPVVKRKGERRHVGAAHVIQR
jgi:hypothetical protein